MEFASIYDQGFVRVAACVPAVSIADPRANAAHVAELLRECAAEGVGVAVFPELALTGYSIEDLLMQEALLDAVETALAAVVAASAGLTPVLVVGTLYTIALIIGTCMMAGTMRRRARDAYRHLQLQAWQLRQLVPHAR